MKKKHGFLSLCFCSFLLTTSAFSATFDVPETLWNSLTAKEKIKVSDALELNLVSTSLIGVIIDVQTLDQSQAGSNAGSNLGADFGSAAYIDKSFGGNSVDYSAKKHLGASLLGGLLGGIADTSAVSSFRTRYTIKLQEGRIQYIDEQTRNQFRHTVGLCVFLEPFRIANQQLCLMTRADLLSAAENKHSARHAPQLSLAELKQADPIVKEQNPVPCKVGMNPVTLLQKTVCDALGGLID
jgi:hypothetical protein